MVQPSPHPAPAPLLSAADVRRIAAELDLRPTKQWGQNFVIDPNTIRRIVQAADVTADEHVLEIGPGLGSLTLGLLDAEHVRVLQPPVATDEELATVHSPEFIEAVRAASREDAAVDEAHGLGSEDCPTFPDLHESAARIAGGTRAAAEAEGLALPAVQAEFGVTRGEISLAFTLTMAGYGLGGILMGRLADRFGVLVPVVTGAVLLGAGYLVSGSAATAMNAITTCRMGR